MKLDIPFFESETDTDCGPLALKMVLAFFQEEYSKEELSNLERALSSGLIWTSGIAVAAKKLGFDASFSSSEDYGWENKDLDFYEKHADKEAMETLKILSKEAKDLNVNLIGEITFEELLSKLNKDTIGIILLDWNVISGKEGYQGHIVPITGYDEESVYINNPGIRDPMKNLSIKREIFKKAWESDGTSKDVVFIHRKT